MPEARTKQEAQNDEAQFKLEIIEVKLSQMRSARWAKRASRGFEPSTS